MDLQSNGASRALPTTTWSLILSLADTEDPNYRERMGRLLQLYWSPVFAYIRVSWHKSVHDAQDLTQAFFAHLLEKRYLSRLPEALASFRAWLRVALKHFLIDCRRSEEARRPKGMGMTLRISTAELERMGSLRLEDSPEQVYDHQWVECLMKGTVEILEERLAEEGKSAYFAVFRAYCLTPESVFCTAAVPEEPSHSPTYEEVAQRLGLKREDVHHYLAHCRRRAIEILEERVRDYVRTEEDVEREVEEILGL